MSLLFCFEFAFSVCHFPRKTSFFADLAVFEAFFCHIFRSDFVAARFPSPLALLPLLFLSSSSSFALLASFCLSVQTALELQMEIVDPRKLGLSGVDISLGRIHDEHRPGDAVLRTLSGSDSRLLLGLCP